MKERTYAIILGILNIGLLVVCGVFFLGKDKTAPEIFLPEAGLVYAEEKNAEELFYGVTAIDAEDGELTDEIVIEKIVTDREKETATITYGVADSAGNVGKATCTVAMEVKEENAVLEEAAVNGEEGTMADERSRGETATLEDRGTAEEGEENSEEDSRGQSSEEEIEAEEAVGDKEPEGAENSGADSREQDSEEEPEVESEERETQEEEVEESRTQEGETEESRTQEGETREENGDSEKALPAAGEAGNVGQNVGSRPDPGRPSMVFRTQEVKVKTGISPAWVEVIEGLHDDKDNYETLLKSLKVNGTYDKNKAGTYNVTLTVTDGEGNVSNSYPMKIVVEEWE